MTIQLKPEEINYAMLIVIIAAGCFTYCLRSSPKALYRLAAWAISRALAIEKSEKVRKEEMMRWCKKLGVEPDVRQERSSRIRVAAIWSRRKISATPAERVVEKARAASGS